MSTSPESEDSIIRHAEREAAFARVRQSQQGLGRPIFSALAKGERIVAVGEDLHRSEDWETFPDFLDDYLKSKLGRDWGDAELAKPIDERHTLLQWYEALRHQHTAFVSEHRGPGMLPVTGVVACYFTVAYGLYLLAHNVELQGRMLNRLKNSKQFQGAYYELIVASIFIRAGFVLSLEDEGGGEGKHCEFSAVSPFTGKRYWVEAKMRGVIGELGKDRRDGSKPSKPLGKLIHHLNAALCKPAADERMIFLDLNASKEFEVKDGRIPSVFDRVASRLSSYQQNELPADTKAYLFVTNVRFHKALDEPAEFVALPFGLGMPDFNRAEPVRLSEQYVASKRHADALRVSKSFSEVTIFPTTFDGSFPSVALYGALPPVEVGETYCFSKGGLDGEDFVGTIISASVCERRKIAVIAVIGVNGPDGFCVIEETMTDRQFAEYRAAPDSYFGKIVDPSGAFRTPYEMFQNLMANMKPTTREKLLETIGDGIPDTADLDLDHLRALYAEVLVCSSNVFPVVDGVMMPLPFSKPADYDG